MFGAIHAHTKLSIGDEEIILADHAKNIGFVFAKVMDGKKKISLTCKVGWFHLRNKGKMSAILGQEFY